MQIWAFFVQLLILCSDLFCLLQRTGSMSVQNAVAVGGHIKGSATDCCLKKKELGRSLLRHVTLKGETSPASVLSLKWKCSSTFWLIVSTLWGKISLLLKVVGLPYTDLVNCMLCADSGDSTEFWIGLWKQGSSPTVEWSDGSPVTLTLWHQYHPPPNQTDTLCAKADRKVLFFSSWLLKWAEELSRLPKLTAKLMYFQSECLVLFFLSNCSKLSDHTFDGWLFKTFPVSLSADRLIHQSTVSATISQWWLYVDTVGAFLNRSEKNVPLLQEGNWLLVSCDERLPALCRRKSQTPINHSKNLDMGCPEVRTQMHVLNSLGTCHAVLLILNSRSKLTMLWYQHP